MKILGRRHLRPLLRNSAAGAASGLVGGLIFWWALQAQDMAGNVSGLLGISVSPEWVVLHLVAAVLLGAVFAAVVGYQPGGHASTISTGALYGLLLWIVGPITLGVVYEGDDPGWSLFEAGNAFPSLIGHLLYGGLTGLGVYGLVALYLAARPEPEGTGTSPEPEKKRVVILGGGFGGVSVAKRLEQIYSRDENLEITLISESNYLLFTPMLAEVASSGLEAQHISVPIRSACVHTRFLRAEVSQIDTESQIVVSRSGGAAPAEEIPYDHLVLALGSVPHYFGLPGVEENSFTLKSLEDATRLRNHVIELLEHADSETNTQERQHQLTFVVVGGGFAGTETVAEMFDLVRNVRRFYPNIGPDDPRFVLIHPRERILPELGVKLGKYALRKLEARGIEFLLNSRVTFHLPQQAAGH